MSEKIIHMCMSIRGALRNMQNKRGKSKSYMQDDDGNPLNVSQARELLYDELAKGNKVLPLSDDCEGFSFQDGCPGHEVKK